MKRDSHRCVVMLAMLTVLCGCTSVQVKRADPASGMQHVCIEENSRVTVPNFVQILRDGIDRNGLSSEVFAGKRPAHCEFVMTYTALRSWDLGTYLSHAELRIERQGRQVAFAQYHLRGKGGLALTKWQGVETKMAPVIDELFADYRTNGRRSQTSIATTSAVETEVAVQSAEVGADAGAMPAPSAAPATHATDPSTGTRISSTTRSFTYRDEPADAARALAQSLNCTTGFQLFSNEASRQVYAASCWGNKKLLIACEQGQCQELR